MSKPRYRLIKGEWKRVSPALPATPEFSRKKTGRTHYFMAVVCRGSKRATNYAMTFDVPETHLADSAYDKGLEEMKKVLREKYFEPHWDSAVPIAFNRI